MPEEPAVTQHSELPAVDAAVEHGDQCEYMQRYQQLMREELAVDPSGKLADAAGRGG